MSVYFQHIKDLLAAEGLELNDLEFVSMAEFQTYLKGNSVPASAIPNVAALWKKAGPLHFYYAGTLPCVFLVTGSV